MKVNKALLAFLLAMPLSACNSDSDSSSSGTTDTDSSGGGNSTLGEGSNTSGITNAENLPKTTDAVIDSVVAVSIVARSNGRSSLLNHAPTPRDVPSSQGLPFAPTDDYARYLGEENYGEFFTGGTGSRLACESLNRIRGAYGELGSADGMSCIMGKLVGSDISDADFRMTEFLVSDEFKVKMRYRVISKDESIAAFEAYYCMPDGDGNYVQSGYTYHDYSGDKPRIYAKGFSYPDNPDVESVKYVADIEADGVDSQGRLLDNKALTYKYQNLFTDGRSNHVESDIEVTPDLFQYNGYSCERDVGGESGDCSRVDSVNFAASVLDLNEEGERNPNLFALGDGAAWSNVTSPSGIQAWFGDTGDVDTGSDAALDAYRSLVGEAGAKTTSSVIEGLDFEGEEVWDCSGDATVVSDEAAISEVMACIETTEIDQNVHLECHEYGLSDAVETEIE